MIHSGKFVELISLAIAIRIDTSNDLTLSVFLAKGPLRVDSYEYFTGGS